MPIYRWPNKDLLSINIHMNIKRENKHFGRKNIMTTTTYDQRAEDATIK